MFTILHEPTREAALKQYGIDPKDLFFDQSYQGKDQLVVRSATLDAMLDVADQTLQDKYLWRNQLLHGASDALINWGDQYVIHPDVLQRLLQQGFSDFWITPPEPDSAYVASCREEEVPIPPNWPDEAWVSQGTLAFVFISAGRTAEVFTYKDPAVPGVCYALPRRNVAGSIDLLGIICQSETTGKACFWDNRTTSNALITGPNITLDINSIGNGSTLRENCTLCHRGYNVFTIHPGSALDLTRASVVDGPYDTDPTVRYTPLGQSHWSNPGPLVLPAPSPGQGSCTSCHELPQTVGPASVPGEPDYCSSVLRSAALVTMPPFGVRAGWPPTITNPAFADHITRLSSCP